MKSSEIKSCELSLNDIDLSLRLANHIYEHEFDEFWTITLRTRENLTELLEILEFAKNSLEDSAGFAQLNLEPNQYRTFSRALWYTSNFEDFFDEIFTEEEFIQIDELDDAVDKLTQ